MKKEIKKSKIGLFTKKILSESKQYFSFLIALLVIQSIFSILLITTETNNKTSDSVLREEFTEFADINITMPDESNKRVGQSIAAASLPEIIK